MGRAAEGASEFEQAAQLAAQHGYVLLELLALRDLRRAIVRPAAAEPPPPPGRPRTAQQQQQAAAAAAVGARMDGILAKLRPDAAASASLDVLLGLTSMRGGAASASQVWRPELRSD
jgi:hypothetical protein